MAVALLPVAGTPALANHSKVTGTIKNPATGFPLANVCVAVGPPVHCFTYSNAAGMYVVDLGALAFPDPSTIDLHFLRTGFTTSSFHSAGGNAVTVNGSLVKNVSLVPTGAPTPLPVITQPPFVPAPAVPPGAVLDPSTPAAPVLTIEERIAAFWARVDALAATALLSSDDLGQWALNVIERDATARIGVTDFRSSTAAMQAALDRAGLAATALRPPAAGIEQRIADFWARVNALQPTDKLAAADLGQWATNVIDRDSRARISVADFRAATAGMQTGIDRARN